MIPVQARAQPMAAGDRGQCQGTGGACMLDDDRLRTNGSGANPIRRAGHSRAASHRQDGAYEDLDAPAIGLNATGNAVACAVGDFNGDGFNDLAVAMENTVLLFRNLGHGKFEDVTAASGVASRNRPSGITFVDYDHDGDLDLFLTGSPLKPGGQSNVLWRNNEDGTFTEWTTETGLGGTGESAAAILTDFNNDRAVDLAVTGDGAAPHAVRESARRKVPHGASV